MLAIVEPLIAESEYDDLRSKLEPRKISVSDSLSIQDRRPVLVEDCGAFAIAVEPVRHIHGEGPRDVASVLLVTFANIDHATANDNLRVL